MNPSLRRMLAAGAMAVLTLLPPVSAAQRVPEDEVKAAVVANLLAFVQWPPETLAASRELRLCVTASTAVAAALGKLQSRQVHGLPLVIRTVGSDADELIHCHAVLAGLPSAALMRAATAVQGRPVLLIGEGAGVLERGAMIGLNLEGGRVVFDVDLAALRKARLNASSKLLRLVRHLVE